MDGTPVTQLRRYRDIRNATPADAHTLLDASPASLVFGACDSSRATRQGRWRSTVVGEILGFAPTGNGVGGWARTDPVGMRIELTGAALKELAERQRAELSRSNYAGRLKEAGKFVTARLFL